VDLVAKEPGDAPPTTDFAKILLDMPKNCSYSMPVDLEEAAVTPV
jgi:hypothetical protein